ncbi:MAG: phosphatase PAP2 family protein [Planctomycetota bacterium]|nr:phosphatase PAP2 family protein [Planctomycetota bacterium]
MRNSLTRWLAQIRARLHGADLAMLIASAIVLIGAWCFAEIADQMHDGDSDSFDAWVLRSWRKTDDPAELRGPPWMEEVVRDVTALGSPFILGLATTIAVGYLLVSGKPHTAAFVLISVVGGGILIWSMKVGYARPRPLVVPRLMRVENHSFPSGHAQGATVFFLTLGTIIARLVPTRRRKVYILGSALALAVLVGVSRVALGVHYPTDVLAGWAGGLVWSLALGGVSPLNSGRSIPCHPPTHNRVEIR